MPSDSIEFEKTVAGILRASGCEVIHNFDVGGQQVDVLAVKSFMGSRQRIAVECKSHASPLGLSEVSEIFAKYHSLLAANLVDRLLLVTRSGVTSTAAAYIQRLRREFHHQTVEELLNSVMDFESYVQHIVSSFEESDVAHYFVMPRAFQGSFRTPPVPLPELIDQWWATDMGRPLALISGYGMGKSTFLRYLACHVGKAWLKDRTKRIPILIDLSTISDEQSLEGLIAKALTLGHFVHNFSFNHFMDLNRRGRLLVLLDAFDEMKHGISWAAFHRNLNEIRRLHAPASRLIIAGRPTIFQSEAERYEVLSGTSSEVSSEPVDFPGFAELELAWWDAEDINRFLLMYTKHQIKNRRLPSDSLARIRSRIAEDRSGRIINLARRPLQLAMIALVLPEWKGRLGRLTETILFEHFISTLIKREVLKPGRSGLGMDVRRRFARELAWLLWKNEGKKAVRIDDLRDDIIAKVAGGAVLRREEVLRELVVGSLLEYKAPGILYFPHRSLQEFLVAELVSMLMVEGQLEFKELLDLLQSMEVSHFLFELVDPRGLNRVMPDLLNMRGFLPESLEILFAGRINDFRRLLADHVRSAWPSLFCLKYGGWPLPARERRLNLSPPSQNRFRIEKVSPERQMEESVIGCMALTGLRVTVCCAVHQLLLDNLRRIETDRFGKEAEASYGSREIRALFDGLGCLVRMKGWHDLPRMAKNTFSELVNAIAVHPRNGRIEFGAVRKAIVRIYIEEASLAGIVSAGASSITTILLRP